MLDLPADFLSSFACAFADAFAKAAHAFAEFFSAFPRLAVRNVFAKAFAAPSGAFACVSVTVSDAAMPSHVGSASSPPVRHVQDPFVLVFLILKAINGCSNWRDRNRTREGREKNKQ